MDSEDHQPEAPHLPQPASAGNALFTRLVETAADAGALAKSLAASGVKSISTALSGINVFGSLNALTSADVEADETHYVLVPYPWAEESYAVFTKRVIPEGHGITNSLPKARIFHVPDEAGKDTLEKLIIARSIDSANIENANQSDFADRLEKLAEDIDRETEKVSGGVVLIGGVVALINPMLGIGIALKGLLPSVGVKASKAGVSYLGDRMRGWNRDKAESRAKKEAEKEIRRLKPQLFENPLLQNLDAMVTNASENYDPFLDRENWVDTFDNHRYYRVTVEAVGEVYREMPEGRRIVNPLVLEWIESLRER